VKIDKLYQFCTEIKKIHFAITMAASPNNRKGTFMEQTSLNNHPFDTPVSSGLRFLSEIIEWVACAWVAWLISPFLGILVLVILIGLPTVFSTPGDKNQTIISTPGPLRLLLEISVHIVGLICVWNLWPLWAFIGALIVVIAGLIVGLPRIKWLLQGAPEIK